MSRVRRTVPVLSLTAAALLLTSCGLIRPGSDELLPEGTATVELDVGETAQISLGRGTPGVGDDWGVISISDEKVADAGVVLGREVHTDDPGGDQPGAELPYAVQIDAKAPGTTRVRVLYCTRAKIAENCDQTQGTLKPPVAPREITVRVR